MKHVIYRISDGVVGAIADTPSMAVTEVTNCTVAAGLGGVVGDYATLVIGEIPVGFRIKDVHEGAVRFEPLPSTLADAYEDALTDHERINLLALVTGLRSV